MAKCPAKHYAMIAHSAGGMCASNLWDVQRDELKQKLKALIFTDSFYGGMFRTSDEKEIKILKKIGIHFKAYYKDFEEVGTVFQQ